MSRAAPGRTVLVRSAFVASLAAFTVTLGAAPAPPPGSPYDRRISAVHIRPAWLAVERVPLEPGDLLTPTNLSAALNAVKNSITERGDQYGRAAGTSLITVTYLEPEFEIGDRGEVAVTLRPFYLALPVDSMGRLTLPVPRELPPGRYGGTRRALPVELGLNSDRTVGLAADASMKLNFGGGDGPDPFSFSLAGQQSLENGFHLGDAAIRAERKHGTGLVRHGYAAAEGAVARQPRADARHTMKAAGVRTGIALAPWRRSRLLLDGGYRWREDRFSESGRGTVDDSPHEFLTRIQFDRIPQTLGFVRAAVWHDVQRSHGASTRRLAARIGYAREWLLRPNQGIGFELVTGLGRLWGVSPEWRRFHGGTEPGNFLYDEAGAGTLLATPSGPWLRSFGRSQAALAGSSGLSGGGTRFRHLNLNVSLPVARWSRPLIPGELTGIAGPDGRDLTIKDVLRRQVDQTGPNMLAASLAAADRLDPAEAQRRARDVFADIQPAAHYIIDRANVFAIKPLLLFDVATLGSDGESETWTAGGIGLQLIVVTARLEVAYMRTLSGPTRSNDNVIVQLGFERLF